MVLASLEKELAVAKARTIVQIPATNEIASSLQIVPVNLNLRVRRVSPDELYCEGFRHRNYFVHLSADQSILVIRPYERGNVVCPDKRIKLNGLGLISPYRGPSDMPCEYNPNMVAISYSSSMLRPWGVLEWRRASRST